MASSRDNELFVEEVFGKWLLDSAIEWISGNMEPEDIFGTEELANWADDNLSTHRAPEDTFDESELERWAEGAGYVRLSDSEQEEFDMWRQRKDRLEEIENG
jgi:hypothetical protein